VLNTKLLKYGVLHDTSSSTWENKGVMLAGGPKSENGTPHGHDTDSFIAHHPICCQQEMRWSTYFAVASLLFFAPATGMAGDAPEPKSQIHPYFGGTKAHLLTPDELFQYAGDHETSRPGARAAGHVQLIGESESAAGEDKSHFERASSPFIETLLKALN
jgi:hypothetical protein